MSSEAREGSHAVILLGGSVREALMAQAVFDACPGAAVFASAEAAGALIGLPSVGRSVIFEDSPSELIRMLARLRTGPYSTVLVPYPAGFPHCALAYFAAIPRRLIAGSFNQWAASERIPKEEGIHPVQANWRLALAAARRPMRAMGEPPRLQPSEAARRQVSARWSPFLGGRRPLVMIPGGGGWAQSRSGWLWPAERYAVVANQSSAERIVIISGVGDHRAVRETRAGIVKPTAVIDLAEITVEEAAALSELSLAVVGHDGDALHVAAAAGASVLTVGRRPDIAPLGDRVLSCWADDERLPARQVLEALSSQARVDSYA